MIPVALEGAIEEANCGKACVKLASESRAADAARVEERILRCLIVFEEKENWIVPKPEM